MGGPLLHPLKHDCNLHKGVETIPQLTESSIVFVMRFVKRICLLRRRETAAQGNKKVDGLPLMTRPVGSTFG